jgi:hypothetical protein
MPGSTEGFAEYYRTLADGELLNLALQREELVEGAATALDAELAARGLGEAALREFKEGLAEDIEEDPRDLRDREPPPPAELPADWFDDDAVDSPEQSLATLRPKGVAVGAYVFWLSGIIVMAWGFWFVYAKPAGTSSLMLANGVLGLLLGILQFVAGHGLWQLKPWARTLAATICWVDVGLCAIGIGLLAFIRLRGFAIDPIWSGARFVGFVWNLLWALYLGSEKTRAAFRVPQRA